jgi:Calcineurin-like phosphoesterase superfamily domain
MRIGLLADIHEAVEPLEAALRRLDRERIDRIVVLGDVFETGARIDETVRLLNAAGATGVWGNHDIGICWDVDDATRARYSSAVLDYAATLRPKLRLGDLLFQHVEPWLDASKVEDLWYFEGYPTSTDQILRGFAADDHRISFHGHYHRWILGRDDGIADWSGERPIVLDPVRRHFVVVNAVCMGYSAIFDSESNELLPYRIDASGP